jgi:hypothetical protein
MSPIWNRKRGDSLSSKNIRQYFLYAVGEIVLVVVGILIALQVGKWKEEQKEDYREIEMLVGIRKELLKDTADINLNIRTYQWRVYRDSNLLAHLSEQKELHPNFINNLMNLTLRETRLYSLQSYYRQLQTEGIGLIENQNLRDSISKFYDFDLKGLLRSENETIFLSPNNPMKEQMKAYMSYAEGKPYISKKNYKALLKDEELHYRIYELWVIEKSVLEFQYLPLQESLLRLIQQIDSELKRKGYDAFEPIYNSD